MRTKNYSIERKTKIMKKLESNGRVEVEKLSKELKVSKETVRRDLSEMEKDGLLKRTHGGAVSISTTQQSLEYPYLMREIQCLEEKERIGKKAASVIEDGDTIFIDNSSTNLSILKNINPEYSVTIVTNSIRILLESTRHTNENFVFISLGGIFRYKNYSCVGDMANEMSKKFWPSKAFISCYGVDTEGGLYDGSIHEIEVKRNVINLAQTVYITADHTKIGRKGGVQLADMACVDYLISDRQLDKQEQDNLNRQKVKFLIAEN